MAGMLWSSPSDNDVSTQLHSARQRGAEAQRGSTPVRDTFTHANACFARSAPQVRVHSASRWTLLDDAYRDDPSQEDRQILELQGVRGD